MSSSQQSAIPPITTEQRADDWIAFANGPRMVWEAGRTREEAIGKLCITLGLVDTGARE